MNIIETITKAGIKTTPRESLYWRMETPRPGDPIDFSAVKNDYPFNSAPFGRVDSDNGWWREDEIHICCGSASVFLLDSGGVSISGGPFGVVKKTRLFPTYTTKQVAFWNWGNLGPGGGHGVYFTIDRPLFRLGKQ